MTVAFRVWELIRQSLVNNITRQVKDQRLKFRYVSACLLYIFLLSPEWIMGQDPPTIPRAGRKELPSADTTASLFYIQPGSYYSPPQLLRDTLDYNYHRYDPARRALYPHATLGNLGSPARSLYFTPLISKGLTIGHQAFDLYKSNFNQFRYYDTNIALSRLEYAQGLSQQDAIFRADFGRNFDKGVNLSVNYQRINQEGQYQSQRAKNTTFGVGVLYRAPKGKLDGMYHYLSNSIVHVDNGGVDNVEYWLDSIDLNINVPVRLVGATTTHRMRELTVQHHLHVLSSSRDSVQPKAQLDLIHTIRIGSGLVRFSDANLSDGTDQAMYYGAFVTDDRGIRNFVSTKTFDTGLDMQFRYLPTRIGIPAHLLRAGVQYRTTELDQEPLQSTVDELFLNVEGRLGISRRIAIDGNGYIGLLDATGEYKLDAYARLQLFKDAQTWGQLLLYQRKPTLLESRLFVDQISVWATDFKKMSLSSLQFHYVHPSIRLRLHGGAHLISNLIFFDAERMPQQLSRTVEVLQVSATKEIQLGPLGILGHLMLQEYDADQIALPHLIVQGQLFYTGRMFKKNLLVRTGFDILMTDSYTGVSYFPVTGQFYYSDTFRIPQYPSLDFFFSMQVLDVFKAFIKMENITSFIAKDHFVQVAEYPQQEKYFRFGLWMKLFD